MIDFFHLGDFKTGTTWMQKHAFSANPEMIYLGDPFDLKLRRLFHLLIDSRDIDFSPKSLRKMFENELCGLDKDDKFVVCSREVLSATNYITGENARRNAERIKAVFPDAKISFIIRDQFSMIVSIYSQYIKMGGTLNIKDFIYDSFESRGLIERLQYDKTLKMYISVFGEENVHFDIYDEFCKSPKEFLRRMFVFIGCKQLELSNVKIESRLNKSLTSTGANVGRFFNHFVRSHHHNTTSLIFPIDKLIYMLLSQHMKKKIADYTEITLVPSYGKEDVRNRILYGINRAILARINYLSEIFSFGKKIAVPDNFRYNLSKHFKRSNEILLSKYNLPINKYNWIL